MPSLNDILDIYSKLLVKAKHFSDEAVLWNKQNKFALLPDYLKKNMQILASQYDAFYQSSLNTAEDSSVSNSIYYFSQDYVAYSQSDENDNILSFLNPDLSIPKPFMKSIASFSYHLNRLRQKAEGDDLRVMILNTPPLIQQLLKEHAKHIVSVLNFNDIMVKLAFKAQFSTNRNAFSINFQQIVPLAKILKLDIVFKKKMESLPTDFSFALCTLIPNHKFKQIVHNRIDVLYRFMSCLSPELREFYYQHILQQLIEKKSEKSLSNKTSQVNIAADMNKDDSNTTLVPVIQEKEPIESRLLNFKALLQSRQASFPRKIPYVPIVDSVTEESCVASFNSMSNT